MRKSLAGRERFSLPSTVPPTLRHPHSTHKKVSSLLGLDTRRVLLDAFFYVFKRKKASASLFFPPLPARLM